jgi:hypothetical protein
VSVSLLPAVPAEVHFFGVPVPLSFSEYPVLSIHHAWCFSFPLKKRRNESFLRFYLGLIR